MHLLHFPSLKCYTIIKHTQPKEEKMQYTKEIFAHYTKEYIRIYQAYNTTIAHEAVKLQTFGENFNVNRMTWIKPSFLWMMYRSNWGTKKNQDNILAIDIRRNVFDSFLERAILTSPDSDEFSGSEWEKAFDDTKVYCQWDPDRNINGAPINRAAIQIGIKCNALRDFIDNGIIKIQDITPQVAKWNIQRKNNKLTPKELPVEKIYEITDKKIRNRLGM